MFTGIIEETGAVASLDRHAAGAKLTVRAGLVLSDLEIGGSIAVNGVCLTAVEITPQSFSADLSPETLERTNLGALRPGAVVNLERPLAPTGRLSGHFVQGHVDGVGEFVSLESVGDGNWWLRVRAPRELLRYFVFKGSIAIDGISLTLASVEDDVIGVAIIPHTYQATTLGKLASGSTVNLECDVIAKHVERLLQTMHIETRPPLSVKDLEEQGF
jgi:riboflavin synthase